MEIPDWIKKAVDAVYDPDTRSKEKEKVFDESIMPLLSQAHRLCKENGITSLIFIDYDSGCLISKSNLNPVLGAAYALSSLQAEVTAGDLSREDLQTRLVEALNIIKESIKLLNHNINGR